MTNVNHVFYGYLYTYNDWDGNYQTAMDGTNSSLVWMNKKFSDIIVRYLTPNHVIENQNPDLNNLVKPFYLKHKLENEMV